MDMKKALAETVKSEDKRVGLQHQPTVEKAKKQGDYKIEGVEK